MPSVVIPSDKQEAVARGLQEAFGTTGFEAIAPVTGGHTPSLVFRITVRGTPYLLKIITRAEDPSRHYASMTAAAEAGLAPRVWFTSVADHVSITDFVEAVPLQMFAARHLLPAALRKLHALPRFDRAPFNTTCTFLLQPGPAQDMFLQKFRAANVFPESGYEQFFALHAQLASAYPSNDQDLASSHNDLFKPDNILYDGNRIWLVDWEAAFLNDRYADLVAVGNQLASGEIEEREFLQVHFGAPPDPYQLSRYHVMQQIAHLFYTMAFLYVGGAAKAIDWSQPVPSFREINRRLWAKEADLADPDVKVAYARAHWEQLLHNLEQPRYREAVAILADGHESSGA